MRNNDRRGEAAHLCAFSSMSQVSTRCPRKVWYQLRGIPKSLQKSTHRKTNHQTLAVKRRPIAGACNIASTDRLRKDTSKEMSPPDSDKKGGRAIEKDALMKLIAEEMVTSLLSAGNNDDDDDDAILQQLQAKLVEREKARKLKKKARRKSKSSSRSSQSDELGSPTPTAKTSLEDAYYSHVSDERASGASGGPPKMPPSPMEVLRPGDDIEVKLKDNDNDSFAGGHLDELVDDKHRRSSLSSSRKSGGSSVDGGTKSSQSQSGSSREATVLSKELGMAEIRDYVMANIPSAVRDQIPVEAWSQIFNVDGVSTPNTTSQASKISSEKRQKKAVAPMDQIVVDNNDDDIDDITVFSDVSGLTGAFPDGKNVESKRETLSQSAPTLAKVEESSLNSQQIDESLWGSEKAPEAPGESSYSYQDEPIESQQRRKVAPPVSRNKSLAGPRKVSWNQVEVRYYERIVTDNPAVQSGPAIGIGWRYKRGGRVDVDYWEQSRGPQRQSAELVVPRHIRERVLREAGVTQREIAEMVRTVLKVKNQRKQTVNNLSASGVEEAVEKARRRFTRLLTLGRNKDDD